MLFLATSGLWIFTALLWRVTRQAVGDAAKGVQVARESLAHAQTATEHELRAYLLVENASILSVRAGVAALVPGEPFRAGVQVQNSGQTPARKVVSKIGLIVLPFPSDPALEPEYQGDETPRDIGGLGGNTHLGIIYPYPVTPVLLTELSRGKAAIVVVGSCAYEDVFGNKWETHFRLMHGGDAGVDPPGRLFACSHGNYST